jgi:hypothetical protein
MLSDESVLPPSGAGHDGEALLPAGDDRRVVDTGAPAVLTLAEASARWLTT